MARVYNSEEHKASISMTAFLSSSEETRQFSFLDPANLRRRLGMNIDPTIKQGLFSLDNLHLFKRLFEEKYEKREYDACYDKEKEEEICKQVDGMGFDEMVKKMRSILRRVRYI